jgi:hypothetical protein
LEDAMKCPFAVPMNSLPVSIAAAAVRLVKKPLTLISVY